MSYLAINTPIDDDSIPPIYLDADKLELPEMPFTPYSKVQDSWQKAFQWYNNYHKTAFPLSLNCVVCYPKVLNRLKYFKDEILKMKEKGVQFP
jgi:hypothetical protein